MFKHLFTLQSIIAEYLKYICSITRHWWHTSKLSVQSTEIVPIAVVNKVKLKTFHYSFIGMFVLLCLSVSTHIVDIVNEPKEVTKLKDSIAILEQVAYSQQTYIDRLVKERNQLAKDANLQEGRATKYRLISVELKNRLHKLQKEVTTQKVQYTSDYIKEHSSETDSIKLAKILVEASEIHGVPLTVLRSVAHIESDFRADVVSSAGAGGLMQVMPRWKTYCPDLITVKGNVHCAARILKYECKRAKSLKECLANYNGSDSPASVMRYWNKYTTVAFN